MIIENSDKINYILIQNINTRREVLLVYRIRDNKLYIND